jgi:hypothetical protein
MAGGECGGAIAGRGRAVAGRGGASRGADGTFRNLASGDAGRGEVGDSGTRACRNRAGGDGVRIRFGNRKQRREVYRGSGADHGRLFGEWKVFRLSDDAGPIEDCGGGVAAGRLFAGVDQRRRRVAREDFRSNDGKAAGGSDGDQECRAASGGTDSHLAAAGAIDDSTRSICFELHAAVAAAGGTGSRERRLHSLRSSLVRAEASHGSLAIARWRAAAERRDSPAAQ